MILGVEMHGSEINIHPYEILRGKSVAGSLFGGLKPKSDIPILAQKYLDKVSSNGARIKIRKQGDNKT